MRWPTASPAAGGGRLWCCGLCRQWVSGFHDCAALAATHTAGHDLTDARAALFRLAGELAKLTMDVPQDKQAAVWAAYYELQAALK